jgi:threonine dehydratase
VLLKLENLQHTGSFKTRGAFNKLLTIDHASRSEGIIAASSGNHGAAVAWCAHELGTAATIFVPEGASAAKIGKIRTYGAVVRIHGIDGLDTEIFAREEARLRGQAYVSPYNDEAVIAGQGTVGVELLEQDADLDAVFIAVGGGGLIGGVGAWLRDHAPNVQVIGAVPANSPVMAASVRAGRILEMESQPTLSDGTAGGIERDSMTFALCQEVVDDWVVIPEDEIGRVLREFVIDHDMPIEGAAAVAVAGAIRLAPTAGWRRIGIVICGGNIAAETLATVMESRSPA